MEKSSSRAVVSFIFGLCFWIPIINLIFGILAIYHGARALANIRKHPDRYYGKIFAIAGITLGTLVYITYFSGLVVCLYWNKAVCNIIGLAQLG